MPRSVMILATAFLGTGALAWSESSQGRTPQRAAPATVEDKRIRAIMAAPDSGNAAQRYGDLF